MYTNPKSKNIETLKRPLQLASPNLKTSGHQLYTHLSPVNHVGPLSLEDNENYLRQKKHVLSSGKSTKKHHRVSTKTSGQTSQSMLQEVL